MKTTTRNWLKKPEGWELLERHELIAIISIYNRWNADQPISDALHNKHYKEEIEPMVKLTERQYNEWVNENKTK